MRKRWGAVRSKSAEAGEQRVDDGGRDLSR
jgi:hypothetical protein